MESSEEQNLSEIEIFCNIINVFIITFDQFKASLLNKSINSYNFFFKKKKKLYWLQDFEWYLFQIKADLWIFLFIKESWKNYVLNCLKHW